jgi:hypothetical protein
MQRTLNLTHFPDEILLYIFSYLNTPTELCLLACVCKRWRAISSDDTLWRPLFVKDWGPFFDSFEGEKRSIKQEYFRRKKEFLEKIDRMTAKSYSKKRTFSQLSGTLPVTFSWSSKQNLLQTFVSNDRTPNLSSFEMPFNSEFCHSAQHNQLSNERDQKRRCLKQKKVSVRQTQSHYHANQQTDRQHTFFVCGRIDVTILLLQKERQAQAVQQRLNIQKEFFERLDRDFQLVVVPSSPSSKV